MCMQIQPTTKWSPETTEPKGKSVGSLRRKIWNLPVAAYCPVIGVCLPMTRLQILLKKAGYEINQLTHYEQHQLAVAEARHHTRFAEIVQRNLDTQFDLTLKLLKPIRDESILLQHWLDDVASGHWAATFWALLTHPSISVDTINRLIGDVHMLQHQVGMTSRSEQIQVLQNHNEKKDLRHRIEKLQDRFTQQQKRWSLRQLQLEEQIADTGLRLSRVSAENASMREALEKTETASGTQRLHTLQAENDALRKELAIYWRALRKGPTTSAPENAPTATPSPENLSADKPWQWLQSPKANSVRTRSVVCVGGSASQVPAYREVVESHGAVFVHHDGGLEHKLTRLDQYLAQADLVICQTGCVSHNAYWKVKEHCKRHDKPCAFVGNPSPQAVRQVFESLQTSHDTLDT